MILFPGVWNCWLPILVLFEYGVCGGQGVSRVSIAFTLLTRVFILRLNSECKSKLINDLKCLFSIPAYEDSYRLSVSLSNVRDDRLIPKVHLVKEVQSNY